MPEAPSEGGGTGAATTHGAASTTATPTPSTTQYANYANYVAQTLLAATVGTQAAVPNEFAVAELDTAILTDPVTIKAYRDSIASQMNTQSGGPRFEDLSDRIADIVLDDSAQGASTIEVHVIDPVWLLLISGFIQTDQDGYLWPPIDINFPTGTDCVWRLCQVAATKDFTQPNLTLTFEDRIVSILRQMSPANGLQQGQPNQTLGGFISMLVDSANQTFRGSNIRVVEMISPQDPNYTAPITSLPNAEKPLRKNPIKAKKGVSDSQGDAIGALTRILQGTFGEVRSMTMSAVGPNVAQALQKALGGKSQIYPPGF